MWPDDKTEKEFIETYATDIWASCFPPAGYNIVSSNSMWRDDFIGSHNAELEKLRSSDEILQRRTGKKRPWQTVNKKNLIGE